MGSKAFSFLYLAVLSSILCISYHDCSAQSSGSSSSIPSATNDVKAGDWIYWRANRNILTEVPTATGAASNQSVSKPSAADESAAASALEAAANAAIQNVALKPVKSGTNPAAPGAPKDGANIDQGGANGELQGVIDAAKQAAADAKKKAAAANPKSSTTESTVAAAQELIEAATTAVAEALKNEESAELQKMADELYLAKAKKPTEELKTKAAASAKDADSKKASKAAALAYLNAATTAYKNVVANLAAEKVPTFCAPSDSRFLVTNIIAGSTPSSGKTGSAAGNSSTKAVASTTSSTDSASTPKTVQGIYPSWSSPLHFYFRAIKQYGPTNGRLEDSYYQSISPCSDKSSQIAHYDTLYEFPYNGEIAANDYEREGWTWGPMVIPYKFYLHSRTFKGNPSTVAYVGYEGWFPGISLSYVLALGPGIAQSTPATPTPPTSTATTTVVTYTGATGFVATFGSAIKAGILVGKDWQGKGSNFAYEGRTWIALSIGTGF